MPLGKQRVNVGAMNRALSLARPAPRHWLRRRVRPREELFVFDDADHDLKLFALSFTAFFVCIYTLIL